MLSDETVKDIMHLDPLELPADVTVEETTQRVLPGQVIIIVDEGSRPIGILREEIVHKITSPELPLAEFRDLFVEPTLTSPDTLLWDILHGIFYSSAIRWHIVLEEDRIVGVVPPETIFQRLRQSEEYRRLSRAAEPRLETYGGQPSSPGALGSQLYGDPISTPPSLCYRCQSDSPHRVAPHQVNKLAPNGDPYCPQHESVMTSFENPCLG